MNPRLQSYMVHVLSVLLFMVVAAGTARGQARITTKDTAVVSGEIVSEGKDTVVVRRGDSSLASCARKDIAAIDIDEGGRPFEEFVQPMPADPPSADIALGGVIGPPGGLNIVFTYEANGFGNRIVVGATPRGWRGAEADYGVEADYAVPIVFKPDWSLQAFLGVMFSTLIKPTIEPGVEPSTPPIIVAGLSLKWHGWYLTAVGWRLDALFIPPIQIGYIHEFR